MKLKLVSLLSIGLWMISFQAKADSQSPLSRIPNQYDWACRVDLKQASSTTQALFDLTAKFTPENDSSNSLKSLYESYVEEFNKIGLNGNTISFCYLFGKDSGHQALLLLEASIPEENLVNNLKNNKSYQLAAEVVDGRKIYSVLNPKLQLSAIKGGWAKQNIFSGETGTARQSNCFFTYLDDHTILSSTAKEQLTTYFSAISADSQPAQFFHVDTLDQNPIMWVGSKLKTKLQNRKIGDQSTSAKTLSNTPEGEADEFFAAMFRDDGENGVLSIDFLVEACGQAKAMTISSSAQFFTSMLTMKSGNPKLLDCFRITTHGNKVSGKLKINEEVLKALCNSLPPKGVTPIEIKFVDGVDSGRVNQGLTIKSEE